MTHALKTWPSFFKEIINGVKTFEIRKNDRDFKIGDRLLLQEYDPENKSYTGKDWDGEIVYVFSDEKFGVKKGYVVLGIAESRINNS